MANQLQFNLNINASGVAQTSQAFQSTASAIAGINEHAKKSAPLFDLSAQSIRNFGRNIQWTGQRFTMGLTVPLTLFGNQAVETFLTVNQAFTKLEMVWNGTEDQLNMLKDSAVELSNKFGMAQEDILGVFTELAKADLGKTPEEMKRLGELAAQTSAIFDVDLTESTNQLKSLMLGFELSVEDTTKAIDAMNIIADSTAASEKGIIDSLEIMSGLARTSGMSIRELAAITAVFESNNISASEGANALKFSISRLRTPTNEAIDAMADFGLILDSNDFKMKTSTEQLLEVSKKFKELKDSGDEVKFTEFNNALADLVGRRQLSRFTVLLEDMAQSTDENTKSSSEFAKALAISSDEMANAQNTARQLGVVFDSEAFKVKQMQEKYRNLQAEIGEKLLPIKLKLLEVLTKLIEWFNKLSPETQDLIIKFGAMLAAAGPVLVVFGSLVEVIGTIGWGAKGLLKLTGIMTGQFGPALSSVTGQLGGTTLEVTALQAGLVGLAASWAVDKVVEAYKEYKALQEELNGLQKSIDNNRESTSKLNEVMEKTTDPAKKERLKGIADESARMADEAQRLHDRYEGLPGVMNALVDYNRQLSEQAWSWAQGIWNGVSGLEKGATMGSNSRGGGGGGSWGIEQHSGGLIHANTGMIIPGSSPLRDRVPVMAEQGEGIMSKKAIENLLRNGTMGGRGETIVNINISPGMMIATPGEQRELARHLYDLALQDKNIRQGLLGA